MFVCLPGRQGTVVAAPEEGKEAMRQGNRHADSRQRVLQEVLRLRSDEQGSSAVEYGLTLVLMVIGVAGAFNTMASVTRRPTVSSLR